MDATLPAARGRSLIDVLTADAIQRTDAARPLTADLDPADRAGLIAALTAPPPRNLLVIQAELLLVEGQYLLHYRDAAGAESYKFLSSAALRSAFADEPVDSGWLPEGIVRVGEGPRGKWLVSYCPPAPRLLLLDLDGAVQALTVPLPGLIFAGRSAHWWCWAVAESTFMPDARIYRAPFPNVYDSGAICWGANTPPAATPDHIAAAWDLFWASPFNGHLAGGHSAAFPNDCRPHLLRLAARSATAFPTKDLVPPSTRDTVAQAVARWVVKGEQ